MRVASRCSASKGTNISKRSDRYQCALASNVERIEPPQTKQLLLLIKSDGIAAFDEVYFGQAAAKSGYVVRPFRCRCAKQRADNRIVAA